MKIFKDEKIKELEKKIEKLERKTEGRFNQMNSSFMTLKEIIVKMQDEKEKLKNENEELAKNMQSLVEKHKKLIKRIPTPTDRLANEIHEKLVKPTKGEIKDNAELIRKAVTEDLMPEHVPEKKDRMETPLDELYEMVTKTGKLKISDAARKLKVHETQVEEWAKILEDHELIEIHYPPLGKPELRKKP